MANLIHPSFRLVTKNKRRKTMRNYMIKLAGMLSVVALLAVPNLASAAGTLSGTLIGNTATLTFSVGGTTQPTQAAVAPSFTVDRKVDVNVTLQTISPLNVLVPGSANVHVFRVTNLSNGVTGALGDPYSNFTFPAVTPAPNPLTGVIGAIDLYSDANFNGIVDAGDVLLLPATIINIPTDLYADILMVGTATASAVLTAANGTTQTYNLVAVTTTTASGAPTAGQDIVWTDAAGTAAGDIIRNGQHSANASYTAATAIISVSKSSTVLDPYGTAFAIPGAVVTYTITIANAGTASATLASIGDPIDPNLTLNGVGGGWTLSSGIVGPGTLVADAADANGDGLGFAAGPPVNLTYAITTFLTTANTTVARAAPGELKAGETLTLTFQATIN